MGFDLLEHVKKLNYENTALIAPAGYGKTQFLLKCFEALKNENGIVPCYIDIAALNTKDLYTELQKYFFKDEKSYLGSIEFFKRFYNMVSAESEIKYVLLINHYEDAFNNESIVDVTNIIENFVKMGCCVIVSSAFNDGKVFKNFKVLKLEPHSKEKIISILEDKFKDSPKFDFKNLKEQVYSIISTPLMLGWYVDLLKTNSANDVMINSEHQLMDRRFNEVQNNDFVLKTAYYCAEHKTKYIAEKELVELLLAHNGKVRLVSRIFGKKHINDFESDVLMLEKYGIAKYEKSSQKLVFSNQICIDYFTAKKIGRNVNNNNFDVFNKFIFSEQICKFLSYGIDKRSLLAELDSLRSNQRGNIDRCFESCDDIVKTTNLVNTLYFYKNSFKDCDLHSLDLRLCNFIGKECVDTDFSNSLCNDACFVPLESETPNFFAISENGKYFATGNKSAVNIWNVKYSTVIYRTLSDESSPFTDIGYKKDTGFVISANSELYSSVIVKIKNGIISQSLNYDKNIVSSCNEKSKKDSADKFNSYGTLCCKQENFALFRSDENSYYGNAYLLFDADNEKLLSVCKVNSHLEISNAVQDGDEIEFLIKNDGKPLRSICFNDSTKKIYHKNYPSLVGRCYSGQDGTTILIDSNNIDSYVKWLFYTPNLQYYQNQSFDFSISKTNIPAFVFSSNHIFSKNSAFLFAHDKCAYTINCICDTKASMLYRKASAFDYFYVVKNNKLYIKNDKMRYSGIMDIATMPNAFGLNSTNVLLIQDKPFLVLGNSIYSILPNDSTSKLRFNFFKKIKLQFTYEYLYIIDSFPWSSVISEIMSKKTELVYSTLLGNFTDTVCQFPIRKAIDKVLDDCDEQINTRNLKINSIIHSFIEYIYMYIDGCGDNPIFDDQMFICGFKNWCTVCDDGIIYFNGKSSCYIGINDTQNEGIKYANGGVIAACRNKVHYVYCKDVYGAFKCYYLFDVYKSKEKNEVEKPIIPIYDLNLYQSDIMDILGLSAGVKDILKKQTEIYTKYLTFDD